MNNVDYSKLLDIRLMRGEDEEETRQFHGLLNKSDQYIESFPWYKSTRRVYFGYGVADICGLFLFEIVPAESKVDSVLWVVVGDLPPAYLVVDDAPEPSRALELYIREMRKWVEAVKAGISVAPLIPVSSSPTSENASDLESRLNFLEVEILPRCRADLLAR